MDRFAFAGKKACDAGASGACHAKLFRRGRDRFEGWQLFFEKAFLDSASRLQIKLYLRAKKNARTA